MSRIIIKHPERSALNKWGILAHVDDAERNRILAVPYGQFQREVKKLEKEVDLVKFPRKKKSITTESWYNPNRIKPESHTEEPHNEDETEPF
jgi:hypothetical protein